MAVSSTNFVSALGTGSGIDIKALAQSLVDAERKPKADSIQSSIDKSKNRVSGSFSSSHCWVAWCAAIRVLVAR